MKQTTKIMQEILYGVAVGDALGFPVQFLPRTARSRNPVLDMGVLGNLQPGQKGIAADQIGLWSDDTSLTLCLAKSLLQGFDLRDQAERFVAWLDKGYLSALDYAFDEGIITTDSLSNVRSIISRQDYTQLSALRDNSDEYSNGNGSLMRILPLLLHIRGKEIAEQFELVWNAGALTHPHIRSALACLAYLRFAEHLINGVDKHAAYLQMQQEMAALMAEIRCSPQEQAALQRVITLPLHILSEAEIKSDGYVISSLEAALWCILTSDTYPETVLKAVNLGLDTDTTAAIAGGVAALIYGYDGIPAAWVAALCKPHIFAELIEEYEALS